MELFKHNSDGSEIIQAAIAIVVAVICFPVILIIAAIMACNLVNDDK